MTVDVTEVLKDFVHSLLTDREVAAQFAEDPNGMLAVQGITEHDLSSVDVPACVGAAASHPDVPEGTRGALQSYTSGSGGHGVPAHAHSAPQSVEHVVQHLNYVTYSAYEGDEYITQHIDQSTITDNSVDVVTHGPVYGDIDVDSNVASGDGAQVIDGNNYGQANTGDGAVQAGHDIHGSVNTGVNTGIVADDVDNAVVGNNNQTAQVNGTADDTVFNFGDGDVTNLADATITDSAVAVGGGNANNASHNTVDDGSAIAVGGHASGNNEDNDTVITTTVDNDTTINDNDTTVHDNDTTITDHSTTTIHDNDHNTVGADTVAMP